MSTVSTAQGVIPFLWFDGRCEEAMNFYASVFPGAEIHNMKKWEGGQFPNNWVMNGSMTLLGLKMYMFDAGPMFRFNEAVSFFVSCKNQEEVDHYWNTLTGDGGQESQCGWLKDKFGVSWQIVPAMLGERSITGESHRIGQMFRALSQMRKLDIAALEAAYNQ